MSPGLAVVVLLLLLGTQAFFSGSEIAMFSADRLRLQTRAESGDAGAAIALELLEDQASLVGTCLLGTNLSVVSSSTVAAFLLSDTLHLPPLATPLVFAPLVLVFGEAVPKTVFQHHGTRLAPTLAYALSAFRRVFAPALWLVRGWGRFLERAVGQEDSTVLTREELVELLDDKFSAELKPAERDVILGLLELSETPVHACMTPLIAVRAVDATSPVSAASALAVQTRHSRLPVFDGRIDKVIGVVHQNDLFFLDKAHNTEPVRDHMREVRFVADCRMADDLLHEMRATGDPMAIVVDEYGGCVGLVTLEDLLEELVGEIEDERDTHQPLVRPQHDGSVLVPGMTALEALEDALQIELTEGDYETVAGWVIASQRRLPKQGETLRIDGLQVEVTKANARAVQTVVVRAAPARLPHEGSDGPTSPSTATSDPPS